MEHGDWSDIENAMRDAANKVNLNCNGQLTTDNGRWCSLSAGTQQEKT
jgi:hypothetical protein